jgi:hypothetical protein
MSKKLVDKELKQVSKRSAEESAPQEEQDIAEKSIPLEEPAAVGEELQETKEVTAEPLLHVEQENAPIDEVEPEVKEEVVAEPLPQVEQVEEIKQVFEEPLFKKYPNQLHLKRMKSLKTFPKNPIFLLFVISNQHPFCAVLRPTLWWMTLTGSRLPS